MEQLMISRPSADALREVWHKIPVPVQRLVPDALRVWAWQRINGELRQVEAPARESALARSPKFAALVDAIYALPQGDPKIIQYADQLTQANPSASSRAFVVEVLSETGHISHAQLLLDRLIEDTASTADPRTLLVVKKAKKSALYLHSLSRIAVDNGTRIEATSDRILYVANNSLPHFSNGYSIRTKGVIKGLESAGFSVVVVTRPGYPFDLNAVTNPTIGDWDEVDGIRYHRIRKPSLRDPGTHDYLLAAADALEQKIRAERPAIVIAASNFRTAFPALIAARRCGVPFVYEVRGFWEITRVSREPEYELTAQFKAECAIEARVASSADWLLTLNDAMKSLLVARGAEPARISVFPNSIDANEFPHMERNTELARDLGVPDGVPVIGYIGSFVSYEGLDDLIEACGRLKTAGHEFRLLLVGGEKRGASSSTSLTNSLHRQAERAGIANWLIMPGRIPHEQVAAHYSVIDIAPLPRKPLPVCELVSPLKPVEAMAMGKAVVVPNMVAVSEAVRHGETGAIFRKGDVVSLTEVLADLLSDPSHRAQLGRNARSFVTRDRTWAASALAIASDLRGVAQVK